MAKATSSGRITSSSRKFHVRSTKSTPLGRVNHQQTLGGRDIQDNIARAHCRIRTAAAAVSLSESDVPQSFEPPVADSSLDLEQGFELVLDGTASFDVSHAGGEFEHVLAECLNKEVADRRRRRKDERTRRDRTENRTRAFQEQLEGMTDAYLQWARFNGVNAWGSAPASSQQGFEKGAMVVRVMDVYATYNYSAGIYEDDPNLPAVVVRHGLLPTSPLKINFTFSIRVMELFRIMHLRCPHLAIEPFVKGLCDAHRIPFRQYYAQQFTVAFDAYLSIRSCVQLRVDAALGRNLPKWRLKNACPSCTYKLEGEGDLIFKMLFTMDGNDSLKRLRCAAKLNANDDTSTPRLPESKARSDSRTVGGDRYLTREEVDLWAKAALEEVLPADANEKDNEEENPCAGRWKNMVNEVTAKMWGIFDETGVFLALCRHGFSLVVADMVQSGELSKYPLAVVSALLDAFGDGLGGGYDIGCRFKTTVDQSELGSRARALRFSALVGSFHGHAHNRICQLSHLATYVKGMGLEDLEGCERFFSKSNHLAPSIRRMSPFHRHQSIVEYMAHTDAFETEQKSINNYRQALELLAGHAALQKAMSDNNIPSTDVFSQWLAEERAYLTSLKAEPVQETLEMEYYQKLVNFYDNSKKLNELQNTWVVHDPSNPTTAPGAKRRYTPETRLRHAKELVQRDLASVQALELELNVAERWTPECEAWKAASVLVGRRRYQRCLDELESLVVSRMFELTKMNMSQTGYKLRKHIAKALQARSQAIRSALERYNAAAALMTPPRKPLSWNEVVEYAFLADFDLLRDCREDVRERAWAAPAARLMLDQFFKMERAREEIHRLNIEIKRMITHMRDEEAFLAAKVRDIARTDEALAHQVNLHFEERTRFYDLHRRRFKQLATNPHFSGSIVPGVPVDKSLL
ncbi:hypothetical protein H0H92_000724 [Tricholoma furcatifolium]|nr:hypothetical protein H0H92_000724 [Tricholoma furcatifolium]